LQAARHELVGKVKHADVVMLVRLGDNVDGSPKKSGESNGANKAIIKCISSVVGGLLGEGACISPRVHAWSDRRQPTSDQGTCYDRLSD